jgi:hypothetical protein
MSHTLLNTLAMHCKPLDTLNTLNIVITTDKRADYALEAARTSAARGA